MPWSLSSSATTVTLSWPATEAQRATSWSCRCRNQNAGLTLLSPSSSSIACSQSSNAMRLLLCTDCCQCDGTIFTSGRSVTTTCTCGRARSVRTRAMCSSSASAKNSLLSTTRDAGDDLISDTSCCQRSVEGAPSSLKKPGRPIAGENRCGRVPRLARVVDPLRHGGVLGREERALQRGRGRLRRADVHEAGARRQQQVVRTRRRRHVVNPSSTAALAVTVSLAARSRSARRISCCGVRRRWPCANGVARTPGPGRRAPARGRGSWQPAGAAAGARWRRPRACPS